MARINSFCTWPARHPIASLLIASLLIIASLFSIPRLHPDTSIEPLFPRDDPAGRAMLRVLDHYAAAEELIVLATSSSADPNRLTSFAERLQDSLHSSDLIESIAYRADSQTQDFFAKVLVPNALFYLDDQSFAQAKLRLTRDQMLRQFRQNEALISAPGPAAQALAKNFLKDPLRLHEFLLDRLASSRPFQTWNNTDAFISPDGRSILIRIAGKRPPSDIEFAKQLLQLVQSAADSVNSDHLTVEFTGSYAIAAAAEKNIRRDMIGNVITSVILLQLLFVAVYRRPFRTFMLAFAPVLIGILYGFGLYALFINTLTPLTAVIGGILAGLAIDYTIHAISHYDHFRATGALPRDAAVQTITHIAPALFGAALTSIIGFAAVATSHVPALRDFALLGSLGLATSLLCSIFILPPLLIAWHGFSTRVRAATHGLKTRATVNEGSRLPLGRFLSFLGSHRRPILILTSTLFLSALLPPLFSRPLLPLESDLTVMHPRPNPALDAQHHITEHFGTSAGSLIIHLESDSPEHLLILSHQVANHLRNQPGITHTFGLSTLLPDPSLTQQRLQQTSPAYAHQVISDFNDVASRSLFDPAAFKPYTDFLSQLLTRTAPPTIGDLLSYPTLARTILPRSASPTSPPTQSIALIFVTGDLDTRADRERIISTINAALDKTPGATLTGLSVLAHNAEQAIRRDLPAISLLALVLVTLYMVLHFRSIKAALLAILPTIFSLLTLLCFMTVTGQHLNLINLVALPLLIGIDVDYGIFLIHVARSPDRSFAPAAHAIILCAASTILGFASLLTTSVPAVRSLGIAMSVGVASCLFATLFLLLPLLISKATADERG